MSWSWALWFPTVIHGLFLCRVVPCWIACAGPVPCGTLLSACPCPVTCGALLASMSLVLCHVVPCSTQCPGSVLCGALLASMYRSCAVWSPAGLRVSHPVLWCPAGLCDLFQFSVVPTWAASPGPVLCATLQA